MAELKSAVIDSNLQWLTESAMVDLVDDGGLPVYRELRTVRKYLVRHILCSTAPQQIRDPSRAI